MVSDNIQKSRRENASSGLHRRNSSVWKPETGVLYNPIEIIRSKSTRVKGSRIIPPNHLEEVKRYNLPNYRHFADNSVSTTTYKLFDTPLGILYAIPRNLVHQFVTKWANWVFLLIAIINFFPVVGAYNKWLALFPPAFVLTTTMLKDFYEDYRRYRSDREVNNKLCRAYVRSSDEMGVCYMETSNLDGETSLKQRNVPRRYRDWSKEDSNWDPTQFTATILCEKPDRAIYDVTAKLKYEPGPDTKVMVNNDGARHKTSGIEKMTNWFILICCIMLLFMVVSGGVLCAVFQDEKGTIPVTVEKKDKNNNIIEVQANAPVSNSIYSHYQVL